MTWAQVGVEAFRKEALRISLLTVAGAKRRCKVDQGTLRASISYAEVGQGFRIGSNLEYALMVEEGTGVYGPRNRPIVPVRAKVMVFKPKGSSTYVFTTSVKGRKATPYLKPALLEALGQEGE